MWNGKGLQRGVGPPPGTIRPRCRKASCAAGAAPGRGTPLDTRAWAPSRLEQRHPEHHHGARHGATTCDYSTKQGFDPPTQPSPENLEVIRAPAIPTTGNYQAKVKAGSQQRTARSSKRFCSEPPRTAVLPVQRRNSVGGRHRRPALRVGPPPSTAASSPPSSPTRRRARCWVVTEPHRDVRQDQRGSGGFGAPPPVTAKRSDRRRNVGGHAQRQEITARGTRRGV